MNRTIFCLKILIITTTYAESLSGEKDGSQGAWPRRTHRRNQARGETRLGEGSVMACHLSEKIFATKQE